MTRLIRCLLFRYALRRGALGAETCGKDPIEGSQERQRWGRKCCQVRAVEKMDRDAPEKVKAHEELNQRNE